MLEDVYVGRAALLRLRSCVLGPHLETFSTQLVESGYPLKTIRNKIGVLGQLARWMGAKGLVVDDLDELRARAFVAARSRRGLRPRDVERTVLQFVEHLRSSDALTRPLPARDDSEAAVVLAHYEHYLREERAIAPCTIAAYRSVAQRFVVESVEDCGAGPTHPSAARVHEFLLARTRDIAPRRCQAFASALRSFLRFLFLRGQTPVDLACAIPMVRQGHVAAVQRHVAPEDVERILRTCDLSSATGRRDHAILLLLARLGLRAGEIVALDLDDLRWRDGEIIVRGKGLVRDRLPLLADVGAAIAQYVQQDRPSAACRRVFLCRKAPHRGFSHPSSVTTLVTRAFARAGVDSAAHGAHALRHSLATTMVRRGATLTEIGEVLRHRSPATTEIYAKLDFGALRDVGLPWPVPGGGR